MKVYIITEYGGSYDDSWDRIIGIYTDKAKAEKVKDTYWAKVQKRRGEVEEAIKQYDGKDFSDDAILQAWGKLDTELHDIYDVADVHLKEYPLDEFLGGYYNPENAL